MIFATAGAAASIIGASTDLYDDGRQDEILSPQQALNKAKTTTNVVMAVRIAAAAATIAVAAVVMMRTP